MSSAESEKMAELLSSAKQLPAEQQDSFLVSRCGEDADLLARARELLFGAPTEAGQIDADATSIYPPIDPLETTTVDFSDPDALVGQTLDGRFFIEKNLKESGGDVGGIGVVYLAIDTKLMGKQVVVKILNENALKHPDIVRKFEHEKEALVRLDHPGIVRILDSGKLRDGNPFLAMDFIKGHSLRKAIQIAGRLPLDVVANITYDVADALSAAHAEKVLHRDIKPENIMLTPIDEGMYRVRLIDFGIAKVGESKVAPETEISRAIGSAHYIAPEQLIGRLDITPAADIFSLAIVVYEMLTGEPPFKPKVLTEMYQLELEGVKTLPSALRPDLPREAERVLLTALEFDAEKRPQNARAFGRYLAHELKAEGHETERFYASIKTEFHTSPTTAMPKPDPADYETAQRVHISTDVKPVSTDAEKVNGRAKWLVPAAFVLALVAATGGYFAWNSAGTPNGEGQGVTPAPAVTPGPERKFNYYLMIQKMRNGKAFGEPVKVSGRGWVEKDYKVSLNFVPDTSGFMYVFNFGKDKNGKERFYITSPTPDQNEGRSNVFGGNVLSPTSGTAKGKPGTEMYWVIWTKQADPVLEWIVKTAFSSEEGELNDEAGRALQAFLDKDRSSKPEAVEDEAKFEMMVTGRGDEIVFSIKIDHR